MFDSPVQTTTNSNTTRGVSVVICCYNSADVLRPTLEHIAKQRVPSDFMWELIVVDNASTDGTGDLAETIWKELSSPIAFRVVRESQAGLSSARKRGVLESKYPILLFCDDDNWLCPSYVADAFELLSENKEIGICGGVGEPVSDVELPEWFSKHQRCYAVGAPAEVEGRVNRYLYGAGITVRKNVIVTAYELGFESLLSGRKGEQLSAGEDGEIAEWYAMFGYDLWYFLPSLKFKHFINSKRLTRSYVQGVRRGFGKARPVLGIYKRLRKHKQKGLSRLWAWQVARSFVSGCYGYAKGLLKGTSRIGQLESFLWLALNRQGYYQALARIEEMRQIAVSHCQANEPDVAQVNIDN